RRTLNTLNETWALSRNMFGRRMKSIWRRLPTFKSENVDEKQQRPKRRKITEQCKNGFEREHSALALVDKDPQHGRWSCSSSVLVHDSRLEFQQCRTSQRTAQSLSTNKKQGRGSA